MIGRESRCWALLVRTRLWALRRRRTGRLVSDYSKEGCLSSSTYVICVLYASNNHLQVPLLLVLVVEGASSFRRRCPCQLRLASARAFPDPSSKPGPLAFHTTSSIFIYLFTTIIRDASLQNHVRPRDAMDFDFEVAS